MSSRLIALDKQPGMRLVRVGETWRLPFAKILIKVTGPEATMACQDYQLCDGLKAEIYVKFHGVQAIWDEKLTMEGWVFMLVDTKNAFNEINQTGILWTVHNLCPSGYCFVFNCYYRWSSLVLGNRNETASFLNSREVVMQGDPLEMISYGIGILPLIKNLKWEIHDVTQTWYTDYAGSLGTFVKIETYFNSLTLQGLGGGYHPKSSKSILIVHPENIKVGKVFGERHGFKVCTGARYLGGYIGDNQSKSDRLREHTLMM